MAIIFTDGFDNYYGAADTLLTTYQIAKRYTPAGSNTGSTYMTPVTGYKNFGQALQSGLSTNANNFMTYSFVPGMVGLTEICVGFHFMTTNSVTSVIQLLNSNATDTHISLNINTNSKLSVFTNSNANTSGTIGNEAATDIVPFNTWFFVEMYVKINGTNADVNVYRNNNLVISLTNLPWFSGSGSAGNQAIERFRLGKSVYGRLSARATTYDNLYITSGERLGPTMIQTLIPSADTAQKQWIPSTGTTNYDKVGRVPVLNVPITMATNVSSANVNDRDIYEVSNLPTFFEYSTVSSVSPIMFANTNQASGTVTESARMIVRSGSTDMNTASSILTLSNTSLVYNATPILINSATGNPWTYSEINSINLGIEKTA